MENEDRFEGVNNVFSMPHVNLRSGDNGFPPDESTDEPPEEENLPAVEVHAENMSDRVHPLELTDRDFKDVTVTEPQRKIVQSELRQMNEYFTNISCAMKMASPIELCALIKTGMGMMKDRRELLSSLGNGDRRVTNSPSQSNGVVHPLP